MDNVNLNPLAGNKPVKRLSEETSLLAKRYLTGQYLSRIKDQGFRVDELDLPEDCPPLIRHGKNTILTAERSSLDILPEERLAGSASNIMALKHIIPGYPVLTGWRGPSSSISHTTVDFGDAVRKGLKGLEAEICPRMAEDNDPHHLDFFNGLLDVIKAMRIWTKRYRDAYKEMISSSEYAGYKSNLGAVLARLERVPENPSATFAEAVQSFWSFFEFQRLCGN